MPDIVLIVLLIALFTVFLFQFDGVSPRSGADHGRKWPRLLATAACIAVMFAWLVVAYERRSAEEGEYEVCSVKSEGRIIQFIAHNGTLEVLPNTVDTHYVLRRQSAEWSSGILFLGPRSPKYLPVEGSQGFSQDGVHIEVLEPMWLRRVERR